MFSAHNLWGVKDRGPYITGPLTSCTLIFGKSRWKSLKMTIFFVHQVGWKPKWVYTVIEWPQKLTSPRCLACQCRSNTCRTLGRSPGTGSSSHKSQVINCRFVPHKKCHQQLVWKLNFQWYKFPLKHWISKALETVVKSRWQSPLPKNTDLVFRAMINNTNRSGDRHLFSKWYTLRDIYTMYGILTNIWVV